MRQRYLPWIAPGVLLVVGLAVSGSYPLLMTMFISLALVTFFGALAGGMAGGESPIASRLLIAVSVLVVPIRVVMKLLRGESIAWNQELLLFAVTCTLVAAFLLNRAISIRARRRP